MTVELPSHLSPILSEIGVPWPTSDEDAIADQGLLWDGFADDLQTARAQSASGYAHVASNNEGPGAESFAAWWQMGGTIGLGHGPDEHLGFDIDAARIIAASLAGVAHEVLLLKEEFIRVATLVHDLREDLESRWYYNISRSWWEDEWAETLSTAFNRLNDATVEAGDAIDGPWYDSLEDAERMMDVLPVDLPDDTPPPDPHGPRGRGDRPPAENGDGSGSGTPVGSGSGPGPGGPGPGGPGPGGPGPGGPGPGGPGPTTSAGLVETSIGTSEQAELVDEVGGPDDGRPGAQPWLEAEEEWNPGPELTEPTQPTEPVQPTGPTDPGVAVPTGEPVGVDLGATPFTPTVAGTEAPPMWAMLNGIGDEGDGLAPGTTEVAAPVDPQPVLTYDPVDAETGTDTDDSGTSSGAATFGDVPPNR